MALDGILLHKIIQEIKPLLPLRIQRIYQFPQRKYCSMSMAAPAGSS